MSEDRSTSPLPLLLVTEAIRELEKRFENMNDKNSHIETHICNLGKKPGFVMNALIISKQTKDIESLEEILNYMTNVFTFNVFNVKAKYFPQQNPPPKEFKISFNEQPSWFQCLSPPNSATTPQQMFWFRTYGHFVLGVMVGAFLHFGYKATSASIERLSPLTFAFKLEDLDGTWEFSSNIQH